MPTKVDPELEVGRAGGMKRPETFRMRLARGLGLEQVPDVLWDHLRDLGYVESAMNEDDPEAFQYALHAARSALRLSSIEVRKPRARRSSDKPKNRRPPDWRADPAVASRVRAFSDQLAHEAGRRPEVRAFRSECLGGQTISRSEAKALLSSPAARYLAIDAFRTRGIPLLNHAATVLRYREEPDDDEPLVPVARIELQVRWGRTGLKQPPLVTLRLAQMLRERPVFTMPPALDQDRQIPVWTNSVLFRLRDAATRLAQRYPWDIGDAGWFVLTGQAPEVEPITTRVQGGWHLNHAHFRFVIEVEPWVPARLVMELHRWYQRDALGADNRPMHQKTLALVGFLREQRDKGRTALTWSELMHRWNRGHPEWRFPEYRNFARACDRALGQLMSPAYKARYSPPPVPLPPRVGAPSPRRRRRQRR